MLSDRKFLIMLVLILSVCFSTAKTDLLSETENYKITGLQGTTETYSSGSYGAVAVNSQYVFVGSTSGSTTVLDKNLNEVKTWTFQPATMAATEDHLYMEDASDATLKKIRISDGEVIWSQSSSGWQQYNWMDIDQQENIYVPFYADHEIRSYTSEGELRWRKNINDDSREVGVDNDGEYAWVMGDSDVLRLLNASTGEQICSTTSAGRYGNIDVIDYGEYNGYAWIADDNRVYHFVDTSCDISFQKSAGTDARGAQVMTEAEQLIGGGGGEIKVWDFSGNLLYQTSITEDVHAMRVDASSESIFTAPDNYEAQKISITNEKINEETFCNYRGPSNECIMNQSNTLSQQQYNISSVFEARENAVFEAFNGQATLNITNSTFLSGFWRGSFRIDTGKEHRTTIKPGAEFRPENGNIVIGK